MAAQNNLQFTIVDEDDIPLSSIRVLHVDSDEEQPSDVDSSDSEEESKDSDDEEESEANTAYENLRRKAFRRIQPCDDLLLNEEIGMTVNMPENSSCKYFFELFFTDDVYDLVVNETKRFEEQKRNIDHDNDDGDLKNITRDELKAWLGLTLAMGLKSYWSGPVTKVPLFGNTMSRARYLKILRCLHFVNNNNAPNATEDKLWKITPFLNALIPRFREFITISVNFFITFSIKITSPLTGNRVADGATCKKLFKKPSGRKKPQSATTVAEEDDDQTVQDRPTTPQPSHLPETSSPIDEFCAKVHNFYRLVAIRNAHIPASP